MNKDKNTWTAAPVYKPRPKQADYSALIGPDGNWYGIIYDPSIADRLVKALNNERG